MHSGENTQNLARIKNALTELVDGGVLSRTKGDVYLSKYQKMLEVLTQSLQNEAIHLNHLQDLKAMVESTEQTIQTETRKQSAVQQQIIRLRTELSERESCIVTLQDDSTKLSTEETMLIEERGLLQHELMLRQKEYVESLRPRIATLEYECQVSKGSLATMETIETNLNNELTQAKRQLEAIMSAANVIADEIKKTNGDQQRASALPEKYKRQATLVQQALSAAQADTQKRERKFSEVEALFESTQNKLHDTITEAANTAAQTAKLRNTSLLTMTKEAEDVTKELKQVRGKVRALQEENADLMIREKTAQVAKHLDLSALENAQKDAKSYQKRVQRMEGIIARVLEAYEPLEQKLNDASTELSYEQTRAKQLEIDLDASRKEYNRQLLLLANTMNTDEDFSGKVNAALATNRNFQQQINDVAGENRELAMQIKVAQSAQQAETSRLAKLNSSLRQLVDELHIKDTQAERLGIELHTLETRMAEVSIVYERLKTQKNRLARLSQEAKLAINEVKEKIIVLSSESEILSNESQEKAALLTKQILETKDAQRKTSQIRQSLADQKHALNVVHRQVEDHITDIENLGGIIANSEKQLFQLKASYVEAVEQRNYAGVQLVERNDELCILYERLHTQEAVLRDAEAFMTARDEDLRVLNTMYTELCRERDIVRRDVEMNLPSLIQERTQLLQELSEAQADNEQLLLDLRAGARIVDNGKVEMLDLTQIYDPSNTPKEEDPDEVLFTSIIETLESGKELQPQTDPPKSRTLKTPKQPLPKIGTSSAGQESKSLRGTTRTTKSAGTEKQEAIRRRVLKTDKPLVATWNMVGGTEPVSHEKLRSKQRQIEDRMQTVRELSLEKFIVGEELDKVIGQLREEIEAQQKAVPPETMAKLNSTRSQLRSVTRKLMAIVSELSMEQATSIKLKEVTEQLEDTVVQARERLAAGRAPTDEIEHEWLIAHQNELEYQHNRMLLEQELAAQVPGALPSTAKPRFDSYMSEESGLPRPYGARAPFAPPEPAPNVGRFMRNPAPAVIEI